MEGKYKGFLIGYDKDSLKHFIVEDIGGKYETLEGAEQGIDRHLKKHRKIERIDVIKNDGWNRERFEDAEITSITERGEVWTVSQKGKRELVGDGRFMCERTDGNQEIISKHIRMKADGRKMSQDADDLLLTCSRGTIDKLIEKMTDNG